MQWGLAGEPWGLYVSQPAKWGPLSPLFSRLPSDVRTKAPLRVPANTRTRLIYHSFSSVVRPLQERTFYSDTAKVSPHDLIGIQTSIPPIPVRGSNSSEKRSKKFGASSSPHA